MNNESVQVYAQDRLLVFFSLPFGGCSRKSVIFQSINEAPMGCLLIPFEDSNSSIILLKLQQELMGGDYNLYFVYEEESRDGIF